MTNAPERSPRGDGDRLRESLAAQARELQAGFQRAGTVASAAYALVGAILLLGGLGYLGDRWLGTAPWLLISGLFLGIIVGFYELARFVWRRTP